MASSLSSMRPEVASDEPLLLVEFVGDEDGTSTKLKLRHEILERVLQSCGNQPLSIFSICGPPKTGKSFILNYIMRGLVALENGETDWMDWNNKTKPLNGFRFHSDDEKPISQGIWIWSRPFHVKMDDGAILNVLLVDTQGIDIDDDQTASSHKHAILGLSLLMSSVTILNFFSDIPDDIFTSLNTFTQYGVLAKDSYGNGTSSFQNLTFLVRECVNPRQNANQFLEKKLEVKQAQGDEAKAVRGVIRNCFKKLDCFLIPAIGPKAIKPEFTGSISELDGNFSRKLEVFVSDLINPEYIPVKRILGNQVTATEFQLYFEVYLDLFNFKQPPSAPKILEVTSEVLNCIHVKQALGMYLDKLRKKLWGKQYVSETDFRTAHEDSKKLAEDYFEKMKCGSSYLIDLSKEIEEDYEKMKKQNDEKRKRFIAEASKEAMTTFEGQLKELRQRIIEDFQLKLVNESGESLQTCVQTLNLQLDGLLVGIVEKNESNRQTSEPGIINRNTEALQGQETEEDEEEEKSKGLKSKLEKQVTYEDCSSFVMVQTNDVDPAIHKDAEKSAQQLAEEIVENVEDSNHLWEMKEKKSESERRKHQADFEGVQQYLPTAITQVKQMVSTFALYWINTDTFHPQNLQNFKSIYDHCLRETLEHYYRSLVTPYLWDNFCESVNAGCLTECTEYLSVALDPVCLLNDELERQFQLHGYFSENAFEKNASHLTKKFMASNAQNNLRAYELMMATTEKVINFHRCTNAAAVVSEKAIRETMFLRVKNFYNEEMKRYHAENGAFAKLEFLEVHRMLVETLLDVSWKVVNVSTRKVLPHDALEWLISLEKELNDAFTRHKESNELKLVMLQKQINKLVTARYDEYVLKMEDILQKNPDGYDPKKLGRDHRTISKELETLLCIDLRNKIREKAPTSAFFETLQHQINQYWPTVVKANEANCEKKRKSSKQEGASTQSGERKATARTKGGERFCRDTKPDPLIFRLSYSHVAVGTNVNGKFQLLRNPMGEPSTPMAVALNEDKELVYGTEAMVRSASEGNYWRITDFLGSSNFESCRKTIQFKQGNSTIVYEISVEFLLGYLMKSLKVHAENQMNERFSTAVITIPYWFCSTHRIQVKDAGKIAGFSEVFLVNEESAAAYTLASTQMKERPSGCLLVLSENFGMVSAILYSYCKDGSHQLPKLRMIGESHGNIRRQGLGHSFLQQFFKNAIFKNDSLEGKVDLVRRICTKAFDSRSPSDSNTLPSDVIFLTDSENVQGSNLEWTKAFDAVVKNYGHVRVCHMGMETVGSGMVSVFGASVLCQISTLKIGERVRDLLAHDVFQGSVRDIIRNAIPKEQNLVLPEKSKVCKVELQKMVRDANFYQQNPLDGKEVRVGCLEIGASVSNTQQVYPTFEINSEAVVTLKEVKCDPLRKRRGGDQELELTWNYGWTTPNLTEMQRSDIRTFIQILVQHSL